MVRTSSRATEMKTTGIERGERMKIMPNNANVNFFLK